MESKYDVDAIHPARWFGGGGERWGEVGGCGGLSSGSSG